MTDSDRIDERLQAIDPAAGLDRDPHSAAAQRLHRRARQQHDPQPRGRRTAQRRLAVAVTVATMLLMSAAAVASVMFQPDPDDVAGILQEAEDSGRAAVKADGWRPTLRTEQVWCAYEDGTVGSTRSLDFALDEPMTEQDLIQACTDGPDEARHRGLDTDIDYTLCEAVPRREDRQRLLATSDFAPRVVQEVSGDDRPGFPVLLGWDADCAEASINTNAPAVELRELPSLAALNRAREVEIGLTAAPLETCLTAEDAETLARQATAELDGDWAIIDITPDAGDDRCRTIFIDPRHGMLALSAAQ